MATRLEPIARVIAKAKVRTYDMWQCFTLDTAKAVANYPPRSGEFFHARCWFEKKH